MVYKLEHHDLYSKIDKQVNEVVKKAIHNALSHPDHTTLYEALKVSMQQSEDTGATHLPKIKARPEWLKPIPEEETLETPKLDWVISPNDLPETENNWADAMAKMYKDPKENKLLQKTGDMPSFTQWYCKQIGKKNLVKADFKNQIDLINPKGNRVVHDMSKPLPLGGLRGQVTIQAQYFFNKDLEYLVSGNKERRLSISKLKAANYLDFGLEELVPSLWTESKSAYDISLAYRINAVGLSVTVAGSRLMPLGKDDSAAKELKKLL
nr:hypothetical protein [Tanacetum cinerariifolium]